MHPLTAVLSLLWSVWLVWSIVLMLLVCDAAMFPPLKSPLTSFDADEIAKLVNLAFCSVLSVQLDCLHLVQKLLV